MASVNVVANPARGGGRRRRRRYLQGYNGAYIGRVPRRWRRGSPFWNRGYRRRRYALRARPNRRPRLSKFMLGQIDPFDERVQGAKIPDSNTMPSSTFVANDETNLTTGAVLSLAAAAYQPNLSNIRYVATPATASSWTWGTPNSGDTSSRLSGLTSQFQMYRVTSHGVRISVPTAPTSTVGFLHVGIYPNDFYGDSTGLRLPTSFSALNQCTWYKRFTLSSLTQQTLTIVNKIMDCGSQVYRDISTVDPSMGTGLPSAYFHTFGYATIIVAVEGAPASTTAISVEHITHCEAIPLATGVNTPTPAAAFDAAQLEAASNIARVTDATMLQTDRDEHMRAGASAVESTFAGRIAGAFGNAAAGFVEATLPHAANVAAGVASRYIQSNAMPGVTGVNRLALMS